MCKSVWPISLLRRVGGLCGLAIAGFLIVTATASSQGSYQVTNTQSLFVDVPSRRAALVSYGQIGQMWARVRSQAGIQPALPTVSVGSVAVSVNQSIFQNQVNTLANVMFADLSTSDGYAAPKFGVWFVQAYGTPHLFAQFRPSLNSNLAGIPGLTSDIQFDVDTATHTATVMGAFATLPGRLQRTMLSIVSALPSLVQSTSQFSASPAVSGAVQWDKAATVAAMQAFNGEFFATADPSYAAVPTLTCDVTGAAYTTCTEQTQVDAFTRFLSAYGADYLATGSTATAATILRNLRTWASGNSLLTYPGFNPANANHHDIKIKYQLNTTIALPLLNTWALIRQDAVVTANDRPLIDDWIARLIGFSTTPYDCNTVNNTGCVVSPNNHGDLMQSVLMAWGVLSGSNTRFAAGVQRYLYTLGRTRADGSMIDEVSRGACALRYQNLRIASLVAIAELAAMQGYDLYSQSVNGVTLHTAIGFLLDATANQALVAGYAAANETCNLPVGSPMETGSYTSPVAGNESDAAWFDAYAARFPQRAETTRLRALVSGGVDAARPMYKPLNGGNTTAIWAIAPTAAGWWWNATEGGRGFSLETNPANGNLFLAGYMYDARGGPVWYAGTLATRYGNTYAGMLSQYFGGQTLNGPYQVPTSTTDVATVQITLYSPSSASLIITGAGLSPTNIDITRFAIVSDGLSRPPAATQPQTGWWWNPAQGGRGFFVEVQANTIFLAAYMYEANGAPVWYVSQGALSGDRSYSGNFAQYGGGQTLGGPFRPATLTNANVGAISLQFGSPTSGTLTLPNGTIPIQRFAF